MKTKTQRDLNLEYWGRVYDMCDAYNKRHGTSISPQQCVKYCEYIWDLKEHPVFDGSRYDLAVAIIEDTPVFVGDKIYHKEQRNCVPVMQGAFYDPSSWTLTPPPKPKRTFYLNGQQLPCPSDDILCACTLDFLGNDFYFESMEDRNKVEKAINDLLNNARDKE